MQSKISSGSSLPYPFKYASPGIVHNGRQLLGSQSGSDGCGIHRIKSLGQPAVQSCFVAQRYDVRDSPYVGIQRTLVTGAVAPFEHRPRCVHREVGRAYECSLVFEEPRRRNSFGLTDCRSVKESEASPIPGFEDRAIERGGRADCVRNEYSVVCQRLKGWFVCIEHSPVAGIEHGRIIGRNEARLREDSAIEIEHTVLRRPRGAGAGV
jgi:hypothetical protein